jgi:hypothetical protein
MWRQLSALSVMRMRLAPAASALRAERVASIVREPQAELCLRSGFLVWRSIADAFRIEHPPAPDYPTHPMSISQAELDEVYARLAEHGVPLKDRQRAGDLRCRMPHPWCRLIRLQTAT